MQQNNQDYYNMYEESAWERSGLKSFCDRKGITAFFEKYWKIMASVLPVIILAIYAIFYMQKGIQFDGEFYRPEKTENGYIIEGFSAYDEFQIHVEKPDSDSCKVIYTVNGTVKEYRLEFSDEKALTIYENDELYFEGRLEKSAYDDSYYLNNKNGENDASWFITISTGTGAPKSLSEYQLVNLYLAEEVSRGSCGHPEFVFIVVILFIVWLFDIWFPNLFFFMKYHAAVADPEPSDWYRFTQKIGWIAVPIAAIVVLVISLF